MTMGFSKCEVRALLIDSLVLARSGAMTRSITIKHQVNKKGTKSAPNLEHALLHDHVYSW